MKQTVAYTYEWKIHQNEKSFTYEPYCDRDTLLVLFSIFSKYCQPILRAFEIEEKHVISLPPPIVSTSAKRMMCRAK